ncbi:hypothetical protein BD289DRAFT_420973 [Coniella lustricola]|uniref:Uncharacterized protein n=1 Tax=Coniella lustricola TaxID=2025994 RepID=A0A2T3AMP7_9PEZI|nr:hypothetical protein BD289DRAFT_420973 [Coniella lustricola]
MPKYITLSRLVLILYSSSVLGLMRVDVDGMRWIRAISFDTSNQYTQKKKEDIERSKVLQLVPRYIMKDKLCMYKDPAGGNKIHA